MPTLKSQRTRAFEQRMGARIRSARLASGMTLMQLAEALGVTIPQVHKYETGVDRVSSEAVQEIAAATGIPVASFFDVAPAAEINPERGEALQMATVLVRLPRPLRMRLMQLAVTLAAAEKGKA